MLDGESLRSSRFSLLIGILISAACLFFIFQKVNFDEVKHAFVRFEWHYFAIGIASLAFGYAMRILRWSRILNAGGAHVGMRQCAAPFLGSIALNNVLPLRLGDVVRALVFPSSIGVSRSTSSSSLVMERLVDLMTLLVCLAASLAASRQLSMPAWVGNTATMLAVVGLLSLLAIFVFSGILSRRLASSRWKPARTIGRLLESFDAMSRPRVLGPLFVLSLLIWLGEAGLFYSLLAGFGLGATPTTAIIVMAIATLATLVPSSPGYVGPFHLAAFTAISAFGGSAEQAASFAVLSHLGLWLPTTLAGAIAIAATPRMFVGLRRKQAA
jgi:uncharacterized protein (TIRG00374 family)